MNEEVEQECNLTLGSLSGSEPGQVTAEICRLYSRNGDVDCAEILDASESTADMLLSGSTAEMVIDGQLRRVISAEREEDSVYLGLAPSPF